MFKDKNLPEFGGKLEKKLSSAELLELWLDVAKVQDLIFSLDHKYNYFQVWNKEKLTKKNVTTI